MLKYPSIPAAIFTGAIVMPIFVFGMKFLETNYHSQILSLLWAIVAFFFPIIMATFDIKYALKRQRELGSIFYPLLTREDFKLLYIPAWKRMLSWFISVVISLLLLNFFGVVL